MPEWTGVVVATSDYGIKVVDEGEWLNWSLPDYRGEPFHTNIRQGDRVRIEYAKGKGDKTYISVIENLSRPQESAAPGSVFPPEQDFPPDDIAPASLEGRPDELSAPPAATTDKDRLIVRQVAIKAACEALAISPLNAEEKAGRITYLAGVLEDWVYRS